LLVLLGGGLLGRFCCGRLMMAVPGYVRVRGRLYHGFWECEECGRIWIGDWLG